MVLGGADAAFGAVATIVMWGNELTFDFLLAKEFQQFFGAFVVKTLEFCCASRTFQVLVDAWMHHWECFGLAVFDQLEWDGVGIAVVDDHEAVCAIVGWDREATNEIQMDLISGGNCGEETQG